MLSRALRSLPFCLAALAALSALSAARAGTVRTISGDTFEGDVRLDNGAVTIAVKGQAIQRVDLANVLVAQFPEDKDDPSVDGSGPGVQLRSGAVIGGRSVDLDATAAHVTVGSQTLSYPLANVARVIFAPLPDKVARKVPAGFVGAVLPGGDLFEGEYRGMDDKLPIVKVNSPFLGVHRFNYHTGEILAMALHDVAPPAVPAAYLIHTSEGSSYAAASLQPSGDTLALRDPLAGDVKIPGKVLASISAGPGRVLPLGALRAQAVASVLPAKVPAAFSADALPAGGSVALAGRTFDGGIAQAAGVSVTYAIPQGFSIFVAQAGLPSGAAPTASVAFALLVDGRPVWRSPPVLAGAAPVAVRWNLGTSARTVTLAAEAAQPASLGTVVAWGDAALLKP